MPKGCTKTQISLSLLEYESELLRQSNQLTRSKSFSRILDLVNSGRVYSVHIDVMRPPLIPDRSAFPLQLIRQIYENLHEKIISEIHLMTKGPEILIQEINGFIDLEERSKTVLIIQREAYSSQEDAVTALGTAKSMGYQAGIGINLPTPFDNLTDEVVKNADSVLIMSVPMGKGGQKYSDQATERIRDISRRFPGKPIEVDGGINEKTAPSVKRAGAKILVIGSFVTMSRKPLDALEKLERALENP